MRRVGKEVLIMGLVAKEIEQPSLTMKTCSVFRELFLIFHLQMNPHAVWLKYCTADVTIYSDGSFTNVTRTVEASSPFSELER